MMTEGNIGDSGENNAVLEQQEVKVEQTKTEELVIPNKKLPFAPVEKLSSKQLFNYSQVILWGIKKALALKNGQLNPGDAIQVRYGWDSTDLAIEMAKAVLVLGLNPVMRLNHHPEMEKQIMLNSNKDQILFYPSWLMETTRAMKGTIIIHAPQSYNHMKDVPQEKIQWIRDDLVRKNFSQEMEERQEKGLYAWTLASYPTPAQAKEAGLTLAEYNGQIVEALFLNEEDPVAIFEANFQRAERIKKYLDSLNQRGISHINLRSASGDIDLDAPMDSNRKWDGFSGNNIPSFELFISPNFQGMSGKFFSNVKIYDKGEPIQGVKMTFKEGLLVEATAEVGNDQLQKMLKTDGMRHCGEIALVDKDFSKIFVDMAHPLWDENRAGESGNGSCHIALGNSFFDSCYTGDHKLVSSQAEENITEDGDKRKEAVNNEKIRLQKELGFNFAMNHVDWINTEGVIATAHFQDGSQVIIFNKGSWVIPEDLV